MIERFDLLCFTTAFEKPDTFKKKVTSSVNKLCDIEHSLIIRLRFLCLFTVRSVLFMWDHNMHRKYNSLMSTILISNMLTMVQILTPQLFCFVLFCFVFRYWMPGEPTTGRRENCVEIVKYRPAPNNWNDKPCSILLNFICEKNLQ